MVRKTALVTAMLGAFASQSFAMGLGDIRLNSVLNQPLLAEIQLLSPTPTDLAELRVALASNEAYNKAGVERAFFHTKLRFEIVSKPDGSAVIKITSREPVHEPYLDFLLEATWGSGQVLREYTVLVDPPALMPAPKPVTRAPTVSAPAPAPVARATAPAPTTRTEPMASGVVNGEYRTSRSDTLWSIASTVRPDGSVSMEQTMLGLLEANPNAFYDQNINNLKAGYVLRVPSREEMAAVSQKEALAEVRRQNALWREGRTAETKAAAATKPNAAASEAETQMPSPAADAQLKLVAPETGVAGSGSTSGNVEDLRKELTMAVESVEAQRQENQELNTRLKQLEDQIAQLHRLIELKDSQVSQLAGTAAPTTETTAPMVESEAPESSAPTAETAAAPETEAAPTEAAPTEGMAQTEMPAESVAPETEPSTMPEGGAEPAAGVPVPEAEMPAPAPAPTPAAEAKTETMPASAAAEEGLLETLLANPMFKWAAGGGAVLVALLAWLGMRRRREDDSDFQESILAERHAKAATAAPGPVAPVAAAAVAAAVEPVPEAPAKDSVQSDSSLFTDFAVSDMGAIQNDAEADPVAEADVYLAYGRYQQAEELIRSALNRSPQRNELKLKLLEVLFAAKNVNGFDTEAEALLASLGNQDSEEWHHVVEMGRELNPTNPLYGAAGAATVATAMHEPMAAPAEASSDLDFDLGADRAEAEANLDFAAPETAAEDDNSLDFDMGELASFVPQVEEAAPNIPVEDDLSFDLSGADMEEDAGEGTLASSDEVATKLDLARAYIEMGDPDGARSILDEVMQEGNVAQKSEAESLMQQMS